MKIGFVVNRVATEQPEYTTTRLALTSTRRGHDTWLIGVDDFSHRLDGSVAARARTAKGKKHKDHGRLPRERAGERAIGGADLASTTSTSS